jgi:hypothetical protein
MTRAGVFAMVSSVCHAPKEGFPCSAACSARRTRICFSTTLLSLLGVSSPLRVHWRHSRSRRSRRVAYVSTGSTWLRLRESTRAPGAALRSTPTALAVATMSGGQPSSSSSVTTSVCSLSSLSTFWEKVVCRLARASMTSA